MMEGLAPLMRIPAASGAELKVFGHVQRLGDKDTRCRKYAQMFFTQVNVSGGWLEKEVSMKTGDWAHDEALSVSVDGQDVWSYHGKHQNNANEALEASKATLFSHKESKFSI